MRCFSAERKTSQAVAEGRWHRFFDLVWPAEEFPQVIRGIFACRVNGPMWLPDTLAIGRHR
jgi:hypothetical protein